MPRFLAVPAILLAIEAEDEPEANKIAMHFAADLLRAIRGNEKDQALERARERYRTAQMAAVQVAPGAITQPWPPGTGAPPVELRFVSEIETEGGSSSQ